MTIYLIDYENVGEKGLEGYSGLQPEDKVMLFFNPSLNPKISIAAVQVLGSRLELLAVQKAGKNYLDIYLSACLGRMSAQHTEASFVIVSHDQDYVPAMDYCHHIGTDVRMAKNIATAMAAATLKPATRRRKKAEPSVPEPEKPAKTKKSRTKTT